MSSLPHKRNKIFFHPKEELVPIAPLTAQCGCEVIVELVVDGEEGGVVEEGPHLDGALTPVPQKLAQFITLLYKIIAS